MCKDSEKDCNTCRHNPGCLKKGLAVFLLFIQTGRDRELSRGRCGNPECIYHWHPPEDAPAEPSHKEGSSG